jgi:hypothetical protein
MLKHVKRFMTSPLTTSCSKPPFGLEEDIQEYVTDNFNNIFGLMEKKNLAGFLSPSKLTHSRVPFGKPHVVTADDLSLILVLGIM